MKSEDSAGTWIHKTSAGWDYNGNNSNCKGWTDNAYQRYTGVVGYTDLVTPSDGNINLPYSNKGYGAATTFYCNVKKALVCVEQKN
jgi:hypothetical protein